MRAMLLRIFFFFLCAGCFAGETIYGVMITGKDAVRERFAKLAVENFFGQTYPDKKLVIVNHSPTFSLAHLDPRIIEVRVKKQVIGKMRNIALDHIPENALFATWDDDDWRFEGMLQAQYDNLLQRKADCSAMSSRIEYIFKNDYAFYLRRAMMSALILCRNKGDVRYSEMTHGEDWRYLLEYKKKYRVTRLGNPAHWYLRFQHGNNITYNNWKKKRRKEQGAWEIADHDKAYLKEALKKYQWVYDLHTLR